MAINYTNGPQIPLDKPFSRFNGTPVDPDQIWDTYANAENYAKTAKAYVGQRLYVMGPSDKKGSYVIIDTNGTLKKLLDEDDKDSINSGDSNNNGDSTTIVTTNGNKSLVFDNKSDLDAWLEGTSTRTDELTKDDLISGDLLLITEENTPDYFWNGTQILEIESNDTSGYNKILDYITYEINNNEVTITECDTSISGVHIIPNTIEGYPVTSIGDETFYNCRNLTSITIPNSVTSIGVEAFASCTSLTSITIPESVTNIGFSAFSGCTSLESITIPNSVTSIGYSAFYQCTSLTSIVIPSSVTSIGESTFEFCDNLINIIIPDNITSIYINAFNNCDNLTDVYYEGSEEEWNNIEIDENNEPLLNVTIHYNQKLVTKEETMYDISPWQPNTDYEVGDVVIATLREFNIGDPEYTSPNRTVIAKCVRQHTSDDTSFALDNHEKGFNVEDVWEILQETYAYYDALGRRIHNTYAIKEEVVGKQIDEGGEIFNDYDNNQARTPKSSARGEGTVAGGKGFPIFKLQSTSNLLNNNDYTLSFNKEIKDGGWTFHNFEHVKNVSKIAEKILTDLNFNEETIYKCKIACLLHDVGVLQGKKEHAKRSFEYARKLFEDKNWIFEDSESILDAIKNHSSGFETNNLISLSILSLSFTLSLIAFNSLICFSKSLSSFKNIVSLNKSNSPIYITN